MRIICKKNKWCSQTLVVPIKPDVPISNYNFVSSSEWYTISAEKSGFCLTTEESYEVLGVLVFNGNIRYLLFDDNSIPGFFPQELFIMQTNDVYFDWKVKIYPTLEGNILFFGCGFLCVKYQNLIDLIDGKVECISELLEYKDSLISY